MLDWTNETLSKEIWDKLSDCVFMWGIPNSTYGENMVAEPFSERKQQPPTLNKKKNSPSGGRWKIAFFLLAFPCIKAKSMTILNIIHLQPSSGDDVDTLFTFILKMNILYYIYTLQRSAFHYDASKWGHKSFPFFKPNYVTTYTLHSSLA